VTPWEPPPASAGDVTRSGGPAPSSHQAAAGSRGAVRGCPKALIGFEGLAGLQAVMQLAEHFVEQVSQGGAVSVAAVSAAAVVLAGGAGVDAGIGGPDPADGGEAVVFDPTVGDSGDLARGPGDGRRPCIGLQRTVVGESRTVIADLGQDTGTGQLGQAGKTGDDRVVGSGERRTRTSERRNKNEWWVLATIATASRHHRTVAIGPPPRGHSNGLREKNSWETSLVCRERLAGRKMSPG
jgi:hypothetical protein